MAPGLGDYYSLAGRGTALRLLALVAGVGHGVMAQVSALRRFSTPWQLQAPRPAM
jgi:hypothetical protein